MSLESNKQLASDFFARFSAGDLSGALDLMADDATWWIAGKPAELPAAGTYSKEKIAALFHNLVGQLTNGLQITVKGVTAEGDRMALELESRGELANGRVYEQEYHLLMIVRDGKIATVREYLDTQHVFAVWFAP